MLELSALYTKPQVGAPMQSVHTISGIAGHGIVDDVNADSRSPRQVLLVSDRDLRSLKVSNEDLRANLVMRGDLCELASGNVVVFGTLALRITIPCEACGRLNEVRAGLSREIGTRRGLLARVVSNGHASVGDRGRLLTTNAEPLAYDWRERVYAILMSMPWGCVVSYAALARAVGVQTAYCRAIPSVLRSLAARGAPVHRVVPTDASKLDSHVMRQLRSEGVDLQATFSRSSWDARLYYSGQESAFYPTRGGPRGHARDRVPQPAAPTRSAR